MSVNIRLRRGIAALLFGLMTALAPHSAGAAREKGKKGLGPFQGAHS